MKIAYGALLCISVLVTTLSCNRAPNQGTEVVFSGSKVALQGPPAPEWAQSSTIYEVNIRQFSEEGSFKAVEQQLTRLREMGVDILWFMPIHPISKTKQKGILGSPYAVKDYKAVNPEYGTLEDFKALVLRAHNLGMHVIIDWVPNHTGWDHPWVKEHPNWYTTINGKMTSPVKEKGQTIDLSEMADLNYKNADLRIAMIEAMKYWVKECDIDGYRCDVAGWVPLDFWKDARKELDKIKTVFMLAEWEDEPAHFVDCFNVNYGWSMNHLMKRIARGESPATAIDSLLEKNKQRFPPWYYQLYFTQNHDENARVGTQAEIFGNGVEAFLVLAYTFDGMPLVYNGMEANLSKRLKFFEKDPIYWGNCSKSGFFKTLLTLKHRNQALWNGLAGGPLVKISTGKDEKVYAFYRQKEHDRVMVIVNLSPEPQTIRLLGEGFEGMYTEVFSHQSAEVKNAYALVLKPWEYKVYTN